MTIVKFFLRILSSYLTSVDAVGLLDWLPTRIFDIKFSVSLPKYAVAAYVRIMWLDT